MNRILSWKIEAGVYAYIYLPNSNTHISNRIDETSPIWASVIGEISGWDEPTYKTHFEEMANEISQRYGVTLSYKSEYYNFTDDSSVGSTNIVLLAGEDGNGGSFDGGSGGEGSAGEVYEEFLKAVDDKLNAARADIEAENAAIQEYLETKITQTISEAQKTIEDTKEELDKQKEEMLGRLDDASDALEKAADLFDMGDGNINADTIKEVFSSVQEYSGWMDDYSGAVIDMKTDYDSANKTMGSIGTGEDVTKGAFSKMATSLNVLSGTVGTVRAEMDASTASISEMATWYSENAGVVGEASRYLSASAGVISDTVNYVNNDLNSHIEQEINASEGRVKTELMAEIDDNINNVTQTISSFSASMETALTHYGDELITVGSKMEAMSGTMEEYITKTDSAMAIADDLRESWSIESGKISSVSHAIAETDEEGNIIYYASGETFGEVVVTKNAEGKWVDSTGKIYEQSQVYVHYGEMMSSYIRQTASSTTISVMNTDNVTAAIKLAIKEDAEGDKAVINMVADEVVIDADMIVRAISAKTANIGGVIIDYGSVYSMASAERQSDTLYFALLYTSSAISQGDINGVGDDGYPTYEAIITYTYTMVLLDSKPADFDSSETVEEKILKKKLDKYITTKSASLKYLKGNYYVPMFKLDGIDGTLYAANADIRGKITATSGEIGGSIISDNSIKSKKTNGSGQAMFELNGENGTLYAENADIRGKITATSGEIGGSIISDNSIKSKKTNSYGQAMFELNGETGTLYTENSDIRGKITATSGEIGGFEISDNGLIIRDETEKIQAILSGYREDGSGNTIILSAGPDKYENDENGDPVYNIQIKSNGELKSERITTNLGDLGSYQFYYDTIFLNPSSSVNQFRLDNDCLARSCTSSNGNELIFTVSPTNGIPGGSFISYNQKQINFAPIACNAGVYISHTVNQRLPNGSYMSSGSSVAALSLGCDGTGTLNRYGILCYNGMFGGLRPRTNYYEIKESDREQTYTIDLSQTQFNIIIESKNTSITAKNKMILNLPKNPENGQTYHIRVVINAIMVGNPRLALEVTLNGNGKNIQVGQGRDASLILDQSGSMGYYHLLFSSESDRWWYNNLSQ